MLENLFPLKKNVLEAHVDNVMRLIEERKETLGIFKKTKDNLEVINNSLVREQLGVIELMKGLNDLNNQIGEEINSNQGTLRKIEEVFNV